MTIHIKKLRNDAVVPSYAHAHDAGMDLYACESMVITAGTRGLVPTGIAMAIPAGYVGLIWDKSGVALKFGLKVMGGVIDSGYRGEIKVIVHNLSSADYVVKAGEKVAQMLIQQVMQMPITEVEDLDSTTRGEGGFGSTGLK
ncbi:MAG: deoxyuridine 5'-triphosphate nucleotidohydrolase [Candidatus Buchananbacteria bacterium RIFCSPLOWO2_01_FULL_40_23b]|uniref:dUTP diphosphatase n=1 Tax=Candidatus Buchananbacteria bacterium RIFCSPLOWO2_01_FULL_40_23b TaxID=1797544 RepID=A0A1G1YWM7_9BACT|nr:MAG: deoxyuridine 5'-triphosphate nucleotidohydrolase [Candidatus Buchananbacteria bacterium RIFCSPLOWO2_01_FULL_40_23b]